jgi:RNA-splicing ligase RtcB
VRLDSKIKDLLKEVYKKMETGNYRYAGHASERLQQRSVTRFEVKQVLKNGYHEKRKDSFNEEHNYWNYSIRGKTIDQRSLRIVVSFDDNNMLIITFIDLKK